MSVPRPDERLGGPTARPRRAGPPRWVIPALSAGIVVALVAGGFVGFAVREPEIITRRVVRTRAVPIVPEECRGAVTAAVIVLPELLEALDLARDAIEALRTLDLPALAGLVGRLDAVNAIIAATSPDLLAELTECSQVIDELG